MSRRMTLVCIRVSHAAPMEGSIAVHFCHGSTSQTSRQVTCKTIYYEEDKCCNIIVKTRIKSSFIRRRYCKVSKISFGDFSIDI